MNFLSLYRFLQRHRPNRQSASEFIVRPQRQIHFPHLCQPTGKHHRRHRQTNGEFREIAAIHSEEGRASVHEIAVGDRNQFVQKLLRIDATTSGEIERTANGNAFVADVGQNGKFTECGALNKQM